MLPGSGQALQVQERAFCGLAPARPTLLFFMLTLGPLALPWGVIVLLLSWQTGSWIAHRSARIHALSIAPHTTALPLLVLLSARLGFVLEHAALYAHPWWGGLDIRDGGWNAWLGLAVGALYVAVLAVRRNPSTRALAYGLAVSAGVWMAGQALLHTQAPADTDLPRLRTLNLEGAPVTATQLQGQPAVINLWASWCPPCRREMPVLLAGQRAHPEVQFIWVNQGETPQQTLHYAQQQGLPLAHTWLDEASALGTQLQLRSLPSTLFYDATGQLVAVRSGELSAATLESHLAQVYTRGVQPGAKDRTSPP